MRHRSICSSKSPCRESGNTVMRSFSPFPSRIKSLLGVVLVPPPTQRLTQRGQRLVLTCREPRLLRRRDRRTFRVPEFCRFRHVTQLADHRLNFLVDSPGTHLLVPPHRDRSLMALPGRSPRPFHVPEERDQSGHVDWRIGVRGTRPKLEQPAHPDHRPFRVGPTERLSRQPLLELPQRHRLDPPVTEKRTTPRQVLVKRPAFAA